MKQLTKMLLINWHYISYEVIEFDKINFLTGKNGAGKSTILDALQLLLLGNPRGNFFNKAANDKAGRSLEGYLRGEIGDDGDVGFRYLRPDRFTSYIVCEFWDTVTRKQFCMGIAFDMYKEAKREDQFFYLNEKLPKGHFLNENQTPYTIPDLKSFLAREIGKGKYELYAGNTQYQAALLGKLGGINSKFFSLFRKAVTFTPIDDIEKFIVEYVCDVKNKIDITAMQENIRHYNNLAKQVDIMKQRQDELENIEEIHNRYINEKNRERMQEYIIIRGKQQIYKEKIEELMKQIVQSKNKIEILEKEEKEIETKKEELQEEIKELIHQRMTSDIAKRSDELKQKMEELKNKIEETERIERNNICFLRNHCLRWTASLEKLTQVEYKDKVDALKDRIGYLEQIGEGNIQDLEISYLEEIKETITQIVIMANEEFYSIKDKVNQKEEKKKQLQEDIQSLKKGIRPYKIELLNFKKELEERIEKAVGKKVEINILADLLEIKDLKWQNAIEGYLNTQKQYLIIEPIYYEEALKIYHQMAKENQNYHSFGLVDVEKIKQENRNVEEHNLAEEIITQNELAKVYIEYLLGRVIKCENLSELRKHKIAITSECMLYQGYVARRINPAYYIYPSIGKKALEIQKERKEEELGKIEEEITQQRNSLEIMRKISQMQNVSDNEINRLQEDCNKSRSKLQDKETKNKLQQELDGMDMFWLEELDNRIKEKEAEKGKMEKKEKDNIIEMTELKAAIHQKESIDLPQNQMAEQEESNKINLLYTKEWIEKEGEEKFGKELLRNKLEILVYNFTNQLARSRSQIEKLKNELIEARKDYINHYQLSYPIADDSNKEFSEDLAKIKEIELPNYLEKIEDAQKKAYDQFREDFLAKLKSNIDEVKSQIKDLNYALEQHIFGTDRYSFKVSPKQEYKKFYDMITDSMVLDGWSITTEQFTQKYSVEIKELFDRITSIDNTTQMKMDEEEYEKNIREYTDYKTYLKFDLIVTDKTGNEQRLSKTLSKKSGGETQTPFYISILASFAQVYRTKNNDNTIRLIVFDEAFSKMDSERIEESVKLLKKIGFQAIFAAPPEKIQDVQDLVDSTLCVLNPKENCIVVRKYTNKEEW